MHDPVPEDPALTGPPYQADNRDAMAASQVGLAVRIGKADRVTAYPVSGRRESSDARVAYLVF